MKIGVTGKVGSGKSFFVELFLEWAKKYYPKKIFIDIDIDKIWHNRINEYDVKQKLVSCFGNTILDENGNVHKALLAMSAFESEANLHKLNYISLPVINNCIKSILNKYENKANYILIISGGYLHQLEVKEKVDQCILINANEEIRQTKLCNIKKQIDRFQLSTDEYKKMGTTVINNEYDMEKFKTDIRCLNVPLKGVL